MTAPDYVAQVAELLGVHDSMALTRDPRAWLDAVDARANAATNGQWEAEYSGEQGNCVLPPDARSTRQAVAVTRLYYQVADAEFIASARTDLPAATTALRAVLDLHDQSGTRWEGFPRADRKVTYCVECQQASPCPTVTAITTALEDA